MEYSTCPVCKYKIPKIPDGVVRFCKCDIKTGPYLAIDHTPHYTRFMGGLMPKEEPTYEEWYEKFKHIIEPLINDSNKN